MMWKELCLLAVFVCLSMSQGLPLDKYDNQIPGHYLNSFLVEVDSLETAESVARDNGFELVEKIPQLNMYLLEHPEVTGRSKRSADDFVSRLAQDSRVKFAEQQITLKRVKRSHVLHDKQLEFPLREIKDNNKYIRVQDKFDTRDGLGPRFNDEHFGDQWYLVNRGQTGGVEGMDINVAPAWEMGYDGRGVVVTILDDGIDWNHPDISQNYDARASADMNDKNDKENDPTPDKSKRGNSHGTRCAGEIAAVANNGNCGVGVAYNSKIGGIRILDGPITDEMEARALLFNNQHVHVLSASWGPHDDGKTMEKPKKACVNALKEGVKTGRNGKGSIFVWATGNGGGYGDMCGADGYVSSPESISVQSLTDKGELPFFGEICTSTLISVPTGGEATQEEELKAEYKIKVVTTDLDGGCVENFEGTSSAAPLASGCYALLLQACPECSWRDVQHITVRAARIPSIDVSWTMNGAGFHVNSKYGFGIMDCAKMVEISQSWKSVPEQHVCLTEVQPVNRKIQSDSCVKTEFTFNGCQDNRSNSITSLEHVQLIFKGVSGRRGNVEIILVSPAGTRSELLTRRPPDDSQDDIDFEFMTVHNWGENPDGTWTVEVCDNPGEEREHRGNTIHWESFALRAYGFHDNEKKSDVKAEKPDLQVLKRLKEEEFQNSRRANLKRAQGTNTRGQDTKKKELDDYVGTADELLKDIAKIFDERSFKLDGYNSKSRFGNRKYRISKNRDQFGKRGHVNNNGKDIDEDSEMTEIKREILELLAELEGREYKRNYLEEYLEHKRKMERKRRLQYLLRGLDRELN
ncbi:PC3-like endoprotease variant B [Mercenaria mercenaria]|uniref:PC3-like endoprotease variant B n=1 Tax=Mercenaria mercenaria TaxID=6596 RepID=UPI00234F0B1D|nr:PC3-like endoprotease variant B [Mercenaria mercenaria]